MKKKNEIYVNKQPEHIVVSIITIDTAFPLKEEVHENLLKMQDHSDILLIYRNTGDNINKTKFATLYNICAWTETDNCYSETLFKAIQYCKEIFQKHIVYLLYDMSDLAESVSDEIIENISKAASSTIYKPILEPRHLESWELGEIYENSNPKIIEKSWWKAISSFFKKDNLEDIESDTTNMYCSWTTETRFLYIKVGVISILLSHIYSDSNKSILDFIKTFKNVNQRHIIVSLLKKLEIDILEKDIEFLELGQE